jgi:hypothetical protein
LIWIHSLIQQKSKAPVSTAAIAPGVEALDVILSPLRLGQVNLGRRRIAWDRRDLSLRWSCEFFLRGKGRCRGDFLLHNSLEECSKRGAQFFFDAEL